jgi:cyanate lyase
MHFKFLGMASHPLTMNNMQEKMSQSFDKKVIVWKNELVKSFSEKKFIEEVVKEQHNASVEDAMEVCTINLNKDAVQSCESYTDDVYKGCMSKLPASESHVYDEEEVLNIISKGCNNQHMRYRYIS